MNNVKLFEEKRVKSQDGIELSTNCRQLKLKAQDGKMRETDIAATQNVKLFEEKEVVKRGK